MTSNHYPDGRSVTAHEPATPESLAIRPLTTWPGRLTPEASRVVSPFTAPLASTLRILDRELDAIGARHPVLEVAIDRTQFRIDGRP